MVRYNKVIELLEQDKPVFCSGLVWNSNLDDMTFVGDSDYDMVIGSRYVPEGGVSDWKFRRRIISWTATALAAAALPGRIGRVRDPMSGFFLVKRSVIDGARLKPSGYKILLEVLAHSPNDRVEEAPYVFEERTSGGSKMGAGQIGIFFSATNSKPSLSMNDACMIQSKPALAAKVTDSAERA